jgi:VWFA-related protein
VRTLSIGIVSIFAAVLALAQEPFKVSVDVDLVALDVAVTDAAGKAVLTLKQDDFEIYEDGQRQQIASFTSVDSPYNVLMLFDCSGSTAPNRSFLLEAVGRFTATLRKQDSFALAQFGQDYKRLLSWTQRTGNPIDVTLNLNDRSCGGTDVYGAIDEAIDEFKGRQGRRGVVVLTDGEHQGIEYQRQQQMARYEDAADDDEFQKLRRKVSTADVVFYFVAVDTDLNPTQSVLRGYDPNQIYNMQQIRARLELLASASGGRVVYPKNTPDVIPLYEQIGTELGTSYGLAYKSPKSDARVHKIEVRVRDKSLRVRQSKDSYQNR